MGRGVALTVRQISLDSLHVERTAVFGLDSSIKHPVPHSPEDMAARLTHHMTLVEAVLQALQGPLTRTGYHVLGMKDAVIRHQSQVEVIIMRGESQLQRLLVDAVAVRDGPLVPGVIPVDRLGVVVQQLVLRDVGAQLGLGQDYVAGTCNWCSVSRDEMS